jgi:hypothetical protein
VLTRSGEAADRRDTREAIGPILAERAAALLEVH